MKDLVYEAKKYLARFLIKKLPGKRFTKKLEQKLLGINHYINVNQVDNFIPKAVLEVMNKYNNEYFYKENLAHGGGIVIGDILILMKMPKKLTPLVILGLI